MEDVSQLFSEIFTKVYSVIALVLSAFGGMNTQNVVKTLIVVAVTVGFGIGLYLVAPKIWRFCKANNRRELCILMYKSLVEKIKDEEFRKATLDEIKMVFDGIKQIALAVTIAFGLKFLQEPMRGAGFEYGTRVMVNWLYSVNTLLLLVCGYAWIGFSFKATPYSRFLHRAGLVFLGAFSLFILLLLISTQYVEVPFKP